MHQDKNGVPVPWDQKFEQNAQEYLFLQHAMDIWRKHVEDETNPRGPRDTWIDVLQSVAMCLARSDKRLRDHIQNDYVRESPATLLDNENTLSLTPGPPGRPPDNGCEIGSKNR